MAADNADTMVSALEAGVMVDRYRIEQYLPRSDHFSLLYRAHDTSNDSEVLLKEFAPAEFVVREGQELRARNEDVRRTFHWGLRGFADQAAGLQSLRSAHVVPISHVFEANGTAYYTVGSSTSLNGETLAARLEREQTLPAEVLLPFTDQLLDSLAQIHQTGLLHWDLRPENILIGADGIPWLVDFGAARFVMRFKYRSIRSVAVPGYAPPEVYSATANPGPTLDLYSAAATLYHAICGNPPPDSLLLSRGEATLTPALKLGFNRYPSEFLRAVDWGLRLDPEQRPQSAAQWREAIAGRASIPAAVATTAAASAAPAPAAVVAATAPAAAPAARSEPAARPGKARKNTLRPSPELELQSKPLRMGLAIGGVLVAGAVVVALNMGHKDDDTATTAAAQPAASKSQQPAAAAAAVATRNNSNLPAALDQFAARLNRQAAERAADEARKNSERRQHERDAARERDQARQDAEPSRPQLAAGAAPAAAPSPAQRAAPPSRPATAGSQHPAAQPAQFAHQPAAAPVTTARTQVATIAKAPAVHIPPTRDTSRPCAAPEYPAASREAGETGTTIVDLLIGTDGRVMQSRIAQSSGHKRLDEAARIAFARCKWKAGTVDGEPEMSWAVLKLAWRLR